MTESSFEASYLANQISKKANFELSVSKENNDIILIQMVSEI